MTVMNSQMSSTRSSWWLENTRYLPSRTWSASTVIRKSIPLGSRPENGSSSTSRSGRWTIAAASWTAGPYLRTAPSRHHRIAGSGRDVRAGRRPASRAVLASMPRRRASHTSWSLTLMSMYRPRSWGMYPQLRRSFGDAGCPRQQPRPGPVGSPEHDPHQRRLPRPVRPKQADDPPRRYVEVDLVEYLTLTERVGDPVQRQTRTRHRPHDDHTQYVGGSNRGSRPSGSPIGPAVRLGVRTPRRAGLGVGDASRCRARTSPSSNRTAPSGGAGRRVGDRHPSR